MSLALVEQKKVYPSIVLEFTVLLVQIEGWRGWKFMRLEASNSCINRGPTAHLDYHYFIID